MKILHQRSFWVLAPAALRAARLYAWNKELACVAQFLKTYRTVYNGPDMVVLRVY